MIYSYQCVVIVIVIIVVDIGQWYLLRLHHNANMLKTAETNGEKDENLMNREINRQNEMMKKKNRQRKQWITMRTNENCFGCRASPLFFFSVYSYLCRVQCLFICADERRRRLSNNKKWNTNIIMIYHITPFFFTATIADNTILKLQIIHEHTHAHSFTNRILHVVCDGHCKIEVLNARVRAYVHHTDTNAFNSTQNQMKYEWNSMF